MKRKPSSHPWLWSLTLLTWYQVFLYNTSNLQTKVLDDDKLLVLDRNNWYHIAVSKNTEETTQKMQI